MSYPAKDNLAGVFNTNNALWIGLRENSQATCWFFGVISGFSRLFPLPCQKINMHISICICIYIYTLVLNIINYKLYYLLYITHTYICMIYIYIYYILYTIYFNHIYICIYIYIQYIYILYVHMQKPLWKLIGETYGLWVFHVYLKKPC